MPESKLWAEVWTRPGDANYGRVIDDPQSEEWSFHGGLNQVGDGTMQMPRNFDRFDEIVAVDPDTPADMVSSTVKIFSEENPDSPIGEWLPNKIIPPEDKDDPNTGVFGLGINSLLAYARTEAWDWDGADDWTPKFPDWIYGGRNVLSNGGMEDTNADPTVYWLVVDATAGTYTLSDGTDTTSGIPFGASDNTIENRLEGDITAIDDINVTPLAGQPIAYSLIITATGGTFVLNSPLDTTGNLSAGISAAALETAIEGLSDVTNVTVTAITVDGDSGFEIDLVTPATIDLDIDTTNLTDGTARLSVSNTGEGFELEFVTPPNGITLTVDDSGLTGTASLILVEEGENIPASWTKSQQISKGTPREYGVYDTFEQSSAQAHTGTYSLFVDPGSVDSDIDRYAGAQQVVAVEPGGRYQASVWVYPTAAGQEYRLVLRGIDEDLLKTADGGNAWLNVSPPANTWTQVSIPDVVIPDGDERIIFRFANIDPDGNPAGFYIDDAELNEGLAAATVGAILGDLYDDATSDHAPARIVWEDEANPGTAYLTLDFTDTVDSAGVAWQGTEDIRIPMRFSYSQVMAEFASRGYEYRIVADDVEAGTYLWQVYNPGGMDAAPDVAIQGGASDVRRRIARFRPKASDFLVEGQNRLTSRTRNTALIDAIGRIEASRIDREASTLTAAASSAAEDLAKALTNSENPSYTLINPQDEPGSAFNIGDTVIIEDPPEIDTVSHRFIDINIVAEPNGVEWECQFGSAVAVSPDAAVADAVRGLLAKFEYADELGGGAGPLILGGGGAPTVVVAASDASDLSKSKADFVCTGLKDDEVIQAAINLMPGFGVGGRVLLTEGTFECQYGGIVAGFAQGLTIEGMGMQATRLSFDGGSGPGIDVSFGSDTLKDFQILGGGAGAGIRLAGGSGARVERVQFSNDGTGIDLDVSTSGPREVVITQCLIFNDSIGIDGTYGSGSGEGGRGLIITNNHFQNTGDNPIRLSNADSVVIADNFINLFSSPSGTDAIRILTNIDRMVITGNIINVASNAAGILAAGSSNSDWVIAGNFIDGDTYGINLTSASVDGLIIANNFVGTAGIWIDGGTIVGGQVEGNQVHESQRHGIYLNNQDDFVVSGNVIYLPGDANNTYDGIHLAGTSSRNYVHGNKVSTRTVSPQTRYGVNVVDATCECNIVVGNVLGDPADYGTDALNDAGTDTQLFWPADATYGDNFTACVAGS